MHARRRHRSPVLTECRAPHAAWRIVRSSSPLTTDQLRARPRGRLRSGQDNLSSGRPNGGAVGVPLSRPQRLVRTCAGDTRSPRARRQRPERPEPRTGRPQVRCGLRLQTGAGCKALARRPSWDAARQRPPARRQATAAARSRAAAISPSSTGDAAGRAEQRVDRVLGVRHQAEDVAGLVRDAGDPVDGAVDVLACSGTRSARWPRARRAARHRRTSCPRRA